MDETVTAGQVQTAGEAGSSATPGTTGAATPPQTGGTDTGTTAGGVFTQADIDRIVKDRLAEEKRRQEARDKKLQEEADARRKAEAGQFQELAQQREAQLTQTAAELEATRQQLAAYEAMLSASYEARLKALPKDARRAVEGIPGLSVAQRLAWLEENGALFARPTPPDINAGASGTRDAQGMTDDEAAELAAIYGVQAKYLKR